MNRLLTILGIICICLIVFERAEIALVIFLCMLVVVVVEGAANRRKTQKAKKNNLSAKV